MILKRFFYTIATLGLIAGTALGTYRSALFVRDEYRRVFPDVTIVRNHYPVAVGKDGHRILYKFQGQRPPQWAVLRQIPRQAVAAILMSEDSGFFQHHGYSPEAIRDAWEHNQKPGVKVIRGGSTITQQVVKNLFLSPEKTITRKIRELLLAVELEHRFSKGKILELYLNIAEWGPGIFGIEQASQHYFHKSSANLTPRDAATLAFMLPNPNRYQYSLRDGGLSDFAAKRVDSILERMWMMGQLTDEEYASSSQSDELPSSL